MAVNLPVPSSRIHSSHASGQAGDQAEIRKGTKASTAAHSIGALKGSNDSAPQPNVFLYVFELLVGAMDTREQCVGVQAKGLEANASMQSQLNQDNEAIQFYQIPANATQGQVNQVQSKNQLNAKLREDIQNNIILARQNAQVEMTNANTTVGQVQQDASEDSGLLQTLGTLGQQIAQMLQG